MTTPPVRQCPRCGARVLMLWVYDDPVSYHVTCDACGWSGPHGHAVPEPPFPWRAVLVAVCLGAVLAAVRTCT